jgi:predicted RNase H-like HicB family nuclease
MSSPYTAIVKQEGDWWIGWIEEVPGVNAQEATKEALLASLKVILEEALESTRQGGGIPEAHKTLLDTRRKRVESGEAALLDWDEVKQGIGRP